MNRRLFEDLVVSAGSRRRRGGLAWPASFGIHAVVVGGAILFSIFGPGDLIPEVTARPIPEFEWPTIVQVAPPPVPVHQPPTRQPRGGSPRPGGPPGPPPPQPVITDSSTLPGPDDVTMEPTVGCFGPACDPNAPVGPPIGVIGPPVGPEPGPPAVVHAFEVAPPVKILNVDPVYPELARRASVQGVVIIECTIDPKGRIANARVLRGHPLLDGAALDAVRRWVYTPSTLRGAPVSVIMTVTVNFTIAR